MKIVCHSMKLLLILLLAICFLNAGCGSSGSAGGGSDGGSTTPTTPDDTVTIDSGTLSLATSAASVKSDNSNSATITATVLDEYNVVVEGIEVTFAVDGGQLSARTVKTDENGTATVVFKSGTSDPSNRTATITASVENLDDATIPIIVSGTTITIETDNTSITDNDPATFTVTLTNASDVAVYGATVNISTDQPSRVTLSASSGTTDTKGQLSFTATAGSVTGKANITVSALGASATKSITISEVTEAFGITAAGGTAIGSDNVVSLTTGNTLAITVQNPSGNQVVFSTSVGQWTQNQSSYYTATVTNSFASATLTSSNAGLATVQVYDPSDPDTIDKLTVAISAPLASAALLTLNTSAASLPPTESSNSANSVTITASLTTSIQNGSQPVGDAPIIFTISTGPGGGEYIDPVVIYTDDYGEAETKFYSGSLGTASDGVTINAALATNPSINESIALTIGGSSGSVALGQATVIYNYDDATYRLPMTAVVADTNGNPVGGAIISLSVWPINFYTGYWSSGTKCIAIYTGGPYPNEDVNENTYLEPGEDSNGDGELTPPNSASGSVPQTITCDENGVGSFDWLYPKANSAWIEARIRASTTVYGTEWRSGLEAILAPAADETCSLPDSAYRP